MPMNIGQVIRGLRMERGLTQEQLSLEADVAASNLSRIENGLRQPTSTVLQRLAAVLGRSVSEIYAVLEDDPEQSSELTPMVSLMQEMPQASSLVRTFRELSPEHQELVLEHAKLLKRLQNK